MSAVIRMQDLLALIIKEKKPTSPSRLTHRHNIPDKNLGVRFRDGFARGYLKEGKRPKDAKKMETFYEVTVSGHKLVANHKGDIQSIEQILKNYELTPRRTLKKQPAPVVPLNKKANMAIEGIAQLMDDYQHANQMLKQIYKMIGDYLEANKTETQDNG